MAIYIQTTAAASWSYASSRSAQRRTIPHDAGEAALKVGCDFREMVKSNLRGAWSPQLMGESPAQLAGFGEDFLSSGFGKRQHHFLVFQGVQESDIVLV